MAAVDMFWAGVDENWAGYILMLVRVGHIFSWVMIWVGLVMMSLGRCWVG